MLENWFYIIPHIFFTILLIIAIKKRKTKYGVNYLPLFIISLYFLSASLIYFVKPTVWYPFFHKESYTAMNFTIYSIYLSIFLYPALYIKPLRDISYIPKKNKTLSFFMIIIILLGLFSFLYQLPYAIKGILLGATEVRIKLNTSDFSILPKTLWTTLAVGISYFYLFYIALFFIALVQKKHYLIRVGLIIGSLSYIVSGLAFTTRDVFIFYILGFLFVFLYFFNTLPIKIIKKLKLKYLILTILFTTSIFYISYQRFGSRSDTNALSYGTIGYIAEQPFVFAETIEQQKNYYNGHLRFPLIVSFYEDTHQVQRKTPYEWSFGTFIKDLYSTGGFLFLTIFTIFFVLLFLIKLANSRKNSFSRNLIISLFYFQFMSMGIFYLKLGSRAGNIYMLILLLIYFSTYFLQIKKKGGIK